MNGFSQNSPIVSNLNRASGVKAKRRRSQSAAPISIRFTAEERARIEQDAGGLALSAYVRNCALNNPSPRKTQKNPIADHQALAKALGMLGNSNIFADIRELLKAAEEKTLYLTPEMQQAMRDACTKVMVMRCVLVEALGLKERE